MIQFTTQELEMEDSLKQRIEFICEFCHVISKIINGNIKKIYKTNGREWVNKIMVVDNFNLLKVYKRK